MKAQDQCLLNENGPELHTRAIQCIAQGQGNSPVVRRAREEDYAVSEDYLSCMGAGSWVSLPLPQNTGLICGSLPGAPNLGQQYV